MSPALKMGFELMRPWGIISSVGVHNAEVRLSVGKIYSKLIFSRFPGNRRSHCPCQGNYLD